MKKGKKKGGYLAPALVVIVLVLYYGVMAAVLVRQPDFSGWARAAVCLIPLALGAVAVAMLVQRIREIRSGEEDDLDQY